MSFLVLEKLQKTYPDGTQAVKGIDLSIEEGEFIVLLGPSGCGKTTTLRMIAGLEIATGGRIVLGGEDVTKLRPSQRDVGFVFQFYALYPHLSVEDNIAFPLHNVGMPGKQVRQAVMETAERLQLTHLLRRSPRHLSGGDQQRVSLARAMVRRPRLWLMDEPLGTLDADKRLEIREFIRRQQLEMNVATIYVTHDQEEAMALADRIVVMSAGEIRQADTPANVYDKPADLFVANFVGSPGMNFIKGRIENNGQRRFVTEDGPSVPLNRSLPTGQVTLGIRSEHISAAEAGVIEGKVVVDEYMGSFRSLHVQTPAGRLIARSDAGASRAVGETVRLSFDQSHFNLFNVAGKRIAD